MSEKYHNLSTSHKSGDENKTHKMEGQPAREIQLAFSEIDLEPIIRGQPLTLCLCPLHVAARRNGIESRYCSDDVPW